MNKPIHAHFVAGGRYHDIDFARAELLTLLGEIPEIRTRVAEVRKASLLLAYQVLRESELLADGSTRLAATGRDGRPRRLPDALRALITEDPSAGAAR